jgi:hypothetical protein
MARDAITETRAGYPVTVKMFPGEFLNVDLDIKARTDPSALISAWERPLGLPVRPIPGRRWLRYGTLSPKSPADGIRRYARLVRALPPKARAVWAAASKELDIGVQAGFDRRAAEWVLEPAVVKLVAEIGARVRLTVYSPLLIIEEEAKRS